MKKITQRDKIRMLFQSHPNEWVSLQEIIYLGIAMYPPRIKELRDEEKMKIENKTQLIDGVKHSWYRYTPQPKKDLFVADCA